jgi:predicted nucleic-acid-binding Zn-ribbon protein
MAKTPRTEMKRTCNRCGTERYVSLMDARAAIPKNMKKIESAAKWSTLASTVGSKSQRGTFAQHRTTLELQMQRMNEAKRCPQCGSESYSEVEVPWSIHHPIQSPPNLRLHQSNPSQPTRNTAGHWWRNLTPGRTVVTRHPDGR